MIKIYALLALLFTTTLLSAQQYTPTDNGSSVKFSIKNLGITVNGSLTGLRGSISYNADKPAATSFNVSVDASTINTESNKRDAHLKKEEYFGANQFPTLHFTSYKIIIYPSGQLTANGIMSIKGISKELNIPFTVTPKADGLLFEGTFSLNRRDFKVGGGSMILSDNVNVILSVFAKKN